jgi:signal transduction histidine kinase
MALTQRITDQGDPVQSGDASVVSVPEGGLLLDSSGRVIAISPGAIRMLGRSIAALSEKLEDSDDIPRGRVLEALQRAKDVWGQTLQLVTLERQHRHYVLVQTEIVRQGPLAGKMLAIVTDLTEILWHSDLAGDFVRQARHDLRGPLTSLRGAVDLLRSGRVGELEERQRKLLELMDRAAQQMADMLSAAPEEPTLEPSDTP